MTANSPAPNRKGYRGYICARMEMGRSAPQHIQQLVMRDYCARRSMHYLLANVEYRMPGCTMILDAALAELDAVEGLIFYSLMLFPQNAAKRQTLYRRIIEAGCTLHTAVEGIVIASWEDAAKLEDVWLVHAVLGQQRQKTLDQLAEWDKKFA